MIAAIVFGSFIVKNVPFNIFKNVIIASIIIESIIAIANVNNLYYWYYPVRPEDIGMAIGTWGQHTVLGAYLSACLPVLLWTAEWPFAVIVIAGIIACKSTMSIASLSIVMLIWLWYKIGPKKTIFLSQLIIFVVVVSAIYTNKSDFWSLSGRQIVWIQGWKSFLVNPLMGSGLGSWQSLWIPFRWGAIDKIGHAAFKMHNEYLQLAVEGGIVALAPVLYCIFQFFRKLRPTWHHATCAAIFVNAIGNFPMHIPGISLIFVIAFGYSVGLHHVKILQR
jgi:O-antigen ligase